MSDNRKIAKNTIILYTKLVVSSVIGLLTGRFILQALGAADFGLYSVVGGIVAMMAFLNTVMTSSTYRFVAFEMGTDCEKGVNKVFNISLIIHFLIALLVVLIAVTIGVFYVNNYLNVEAGKEADALFVLYLSTAAIVFSIVSIPYRGFLTAIEKFNILAVLEISRQVLVLLAVVGLLYYEGNALRFYATLLAIVSLLGAGAFAAYCHHYHAPLVSWKLQNDKSKYKEMLQFSGWIMFGAASHVGQTQGSAVIINSFFGTVLNASFGIANKINSLIKQFAQSLNKAVIPQITKSYSSGNTDRTMQLVIYSSKYSFFLMLLPSLPLLLETPFLLEIWLTEVPVYSSVFLQLMIIKALVGAMTAGVPAAVHATGKIKYFQLTTPMVSLLALPISYFLYKQGYPPYTILIVFLITAIINTFIRQYLLWRLIKFDIRLFFRKAYLKMLLVVATVLPLFVLIPLFEPGFTRLIGTTFISISLLLIMIYLVGIESKERQVFTMNVKRVFYKYWSNKI